MPPPLALLLGSAYVLWLLRQEKRLSVGVSAALWIPTLWLLAIASKPLGIWFGSVGDAESGSLPDRLLLAGLSVAAIAVLSRRPLDWTSVARRHAWLLALLVYMLISSLWSDIPLIAARRWTREIIAPLMALVVLSEPDRRLALQSLLRRSAYILVPFSIVLVKYFPELGVDYGRWSGLQMWIGVTVHKNTLGRLCVISAVFLIWALLRQWGKTEAQGRRLTLMADGSVLALALFLLKGSESAYSATSLGIFAVGLLALLGMGLLRRARRIVPLPVVVALILFFIAFGAVAPFLGGSTLAGVSSEFGRDETLTGRTETWSELVPVVMSQPLLGSGFGSFWTTARRDFYEMSNGHNGYLDILLDLGAVGLALFTGWLLISARKFHASLAEEYAWGSLALCFLLMAVVYNTTESTLGSLAEHMTAVVVLASLVVPNEPVPTARRSRVGLRMHVSPQRTAAAAAGQSGPAEHGGPVRLLDRRRRQRRGWARAGNRTPDRGGAGS